MNDALDRLLVRFRSKNKSNRESHLVDCVNHVSPKRCDSVSGYQIHSQQFSGGHFTAGKDKTS